MPTIQFNATDFRALFPVYDNTATYPDITLQLWWGVGTSYLNDKTGGAYCGGMNLAQQTLALNYMTAHLLYLSTLIATGQMPGIETQATIDKISVTTQPPPEVNQWQWWLSTSPYGQQLLALLQVAAAGGFFYNPRPVFSAFRR